VVGRSRSAVAVNIGHLQTRHSTAERPPRGLLANISGRMAHDQKIAAEALLALDTGVLSATTAFGKTVVAAWLIAKRAVNTSYYIADSCKTSGWTAYLLFWDYPGGGKSAASLAAIRNRESLYTSRSHKAWFGRVSPSRIEALRRRHQHNENHAWRHGAQILCGKCAASEIATEECAPQPLSRMCSLGCLFPSRDLE
jgi:hypothetical protein